MPLADGSSWWWEAKCRVIYGDPWGAAPSQPRHKLPTCTSLFLDGAAHRETEVKPTPHGLGLMGEVFPASGLFWRNCPSCMLGRSVVKYSPFLALLPVSLEMVLSPLPPAALTMYLLLSFVLRTWSQPLCGSHRNTQECRYKARRGQLHMDKQKLSLSQCVPLEVKFLMPSCREQSRIFAADFTGKSGTEMKGDRICCLGLLLSVCLSWQIIHGK